MPLPEKFSGSALLCYFRMAILLRRLVAIQKEEGKKRLEELKGVACELLFYAATGNCDNPLQGDPPFYPTFHLSESDGPESPSP